MSQKLRREDGFGGRADAVYETLLLAHAGLSEADSAALDARLVLILANQIGHEGVLAEAIRAARASLGRSEPESQGPTPHAARQM